MKTFADQALEFNNKLNFSARLPETIEVINPFVNNDNILRITEFFYKKYYNDYNTRVLILGINPGRLGSALTGIPFTDSKRLIDNCGFNNEIKKSHEISSEFIYEVIDNFGGPDLFFNNFYINSVCPVGFTEINNSNTQINRNYYDNPKLQNSVTNFIVSSIKKYLKMNVRRDICICLGTGKNKKFFSDLNEKHNFFDEIIYLEHPRYIMQYKRKLKKEYIDKYISTLNNTTK